MPRRQFLRCCGVIEGIRLYNQLQLWKKRELEMEMRKSRTRMISYNFIEEVDEDGNVVFDEQSTPIVQSELVPAGGTDAAQNLTIDNIKGVLSHATGLAPEDISRIFIDKKIPNGSSVKVVLTDEFLQHFTLDQNTDQTIAAISQVY